MDKTIGKFIAVLRKAKGMTQKDLAELLNVSDKTVSRWERDESVPDLALLPVLAEIFDVTLDELILGEESFQIKEDFVNTDRKREVKLEWLLKKKKAGFQAASMISIALACIGVLGAVICRFGFYKGLVAFCVACIGFVLAVCCQVALYIWAKSTVEVDGQFNEKLKEYFQDLKRITKNICYIILLCFVFCLPLTVYFIPEFAGLWEEDLTTYAKIITIIGPLADNWFKYGIIFTIVCWIIITWINAIAAKDHVKTKYVSKFIAMAISTFILFSCIMLIPPYWISEGATVKTYSDFVIYMQRIPPTMSDAKVQLRTRDENFIERLYSEDGTLLCEYKPFNEDVERIEYGENQMLPITIYTKEHYDEARQILKSIKSAWSIVVFVEGVLCIIGYKKKRKLYEKNCTD